MELIGSLLFAFSLLIAVLLCSAWDQRKRPNNKCPQCGSPLSSTELDFECRECGADLRKG